MVLGNLETGKQVYELSNTVAACLLVLESRQANPQFMQDILCMHIAGGIEGNSKV
jgi:hypothetical protein